MNQKVSVLVCAKNSAPLMEDCLKSIKLNNPDEIIVVDGNSTDKTAEISKKYADVVISDEGKGLGHARQIGTLKARNSLVVVVSPDNILPEGCLSQLVKDIEETNFVAVETQVRVLLDDKSTYWDKCWNVNLWLDLVPGERPVIGNPSIYKLEAVIKYGYDNFFNAAELTDLCLRWRKDGLKVGVGNAIAYEKQRLTFSGFRKRWIWYGEGDANFIWKYRNSPKIYLNHLLHPLRTYMIKRSFQAIVAGKIYAVPFLFLCGFFRYVGFARRFPVLLKQNFFKNKKGILITGINGLLGSTLKKKLLEKGYQVYDIGLDISDAKKVLDYDFIGKKIDWIVHTAAITDVDLCDIDKQVCSKVNFEGTKNIVNLAKKIKARLLYISTASVFSGEDGDYKEYDNTDPQNFYSQTKLQGEQAVLGYDMGLILRINLVGIHPEGSRGKNFFEWIIDSIDANKDMQLFSDVMINPLSNWTVAELIEKIINQNLSEKILHIASRNILSKADIAKLAVEKITSYKGNLKFVSVDDIGGKAFRPKQMWLNSDYAQQKLRFNMPSLESEIEKILQKIKK